MQVKFELTSQIETYIYNKASFQKLHLSYMQFESIKRKISKQILNNNYYI